jgi:hypothetical protein
MLKAQMAKFNTDEAELEKLTHMDIYQIEPDARATVKFERWSAELPGH